RPLHDFGELKAGTPLKYSFVVKNTGDADLVINSVTPSCGCTATDFDKLIPPGKEGKITLAIEHTESLQGEVAKTANVNTNDPAMPTFMLSLRASFKLERKPGESADAAVLAEGKRVGPFSVAPFDKWVTSALRGRPVSGVLYLTNRDNKPVRITEVIPGGDDFLVSLTKIQEGKRYDLSITTNPGLKAGQHNQTVRLVTDDKANPEIPIPLEVTVYPLVFVTPTLMNLRGLPLSMDSAQFNLPLINVRKVSDQGGPLAIKSISSTLAFLKLDQQTEADGKSYSIRLSLDKSKIGGPGDFKGTVRIETNDPETPVFEIPVVGSFTQ
ncbi:MAG TPA: DUF1573 domain-containing protein, partial [Blastocatellia bacterium]|nr:DUF1573 domain-containing protein [Blastocatellia bacterium]